MQPYERQYKVQPVVTALMCACGTEMENTKLSQDGTNPQLWHYKCSNCGEQVRVAKRYPVIEYQEIPGTSNCGDNCTNCACK